MQSQRHDSKWLLVLLSICLTDFASEMKMKHVYCLTVSFNSLASESGRKLLFRKWMCGGSSPEIQMILDYSIEKVTQVINGPTFQKLHTLVTTLMKVIHLTEISQHKIVNSFFWPLQINIPPLPPMFTIFHLHYGKYLTHSQNSHFTLSPTHFLTATSLCKSCTFLLRKISLISLQSHKLQAAFIRQKRSDSVFEPTHE